MHKPDHLFLEPSSRCTITCPHCPRHRVTAHRHPAVLTADEILDRVEGAGDVSTVTLVGLGEPFCASELIEAVRRLSRRHIDVHVTTNGLALRDLDPELVAEANFKSLVVSIDTPNPAHQLRPGFPAEQLLATIARLNWYLGESHHPLRVGVTCIRSRQTQTDLRETVTAAARAGVTTMLVKNLTFLTTDEAQAQTLLPDTPQSVMELDATFSGPWPKDVLIEVQVALNGMGGGRAHHGHCPYRPETSVYVTVEGAVYPCYSLGLHDMIESGLGEGPFCLGWTSDRSIDELWAAWEDKRGRMFWKSPDEGCKGCTVFNETYRIYHCGKKRRT